MPLLVTPSASERVLTTYLAVFKENHSSWVSSGSNFKMAFRPPATHLNKSMCFCSGYATLTYGCTD